MAPKTAFNLRFLGGFLLLCALVGGGLAGGFRLLRQEIRETLHAEVDQQVAEVGRTLWTMRSLYLERVQSSMRVLRQLAAAEGPAAALALGRRILLVTGARTDRAADLRTAQIGRAHV
jgi:hypothetical protein